MTSITWPDHLLTLEEWDALPEDVSRRFELVDGVLQMSPRPTSNHQVAVALLCAQLNGALMARGLIAVPDVDVVLVEPFPPLLRAPDIVVVSVADARTAPKRYYAEHLRLAIEIISPGTARVDRVAKMAEYAEAGISNYWIIDLEGAVSLDAFVLVGDAYRPSLAGAVGNVTLAEPVPMTIDLAALVP